MCGRKSYRINPVCPNCGEEHCSWVVSLEESEQTDMDNNGFAFINRKLICGVCKTPFPTTAAVIYWDEVGYNKPISLDEMLKMQERVMQKTSLAD